MWKTASTVLVLLTTLAAPPSDATSPKPDARGPSSFLVVAPDRGFLGNEEVRDAFAPFARRHSARLVFVTDERTRQGLAEALAGLTGSSEASASRHAGEPGHPAGPGGAADREVVVLPLFVAPSSPRLALARRQIEELRPPGTAVRWGRPYGGSYLAVEALAEIVEYFSDSGACRGRLGSPDAAPGGEARRAGPPGAATRSSGVDWK